MKVESGLLTEDKINSLCVDGEYDEYIKELTWVDLISLIEYLEELREDYVAAAKGQGIGMNTNNTTLHALISRYQGCIVRAVGEKSNRLDFEIVTGATLTGSGYGS